MHMTASGVQPGAPAIGSLGRSDGLPVPRHSLGSGVPCPEREVSMALLDRLAREWPLIAAAPYTHWLVLLAIFVAAIGLAHLWDRKQVDDAKSARDAANDHRAFAEAKNKELKEESERQAKKIAELTSVSELSPAQRLGFTSAAMQQAIIPIFVSTPTIPNSIVGLPQQQIEQIASYTRMVDLGAAKIEVSSPTTSSVVPTVKVADLEDVLKTAFKNMREGK